MAKINFTTTHLTKLTSLASDYLFSGEAFKGPVGQILTVYDLIHTTSIDTLIKMRNELEKLIAKKTNVDDWIDTEYDKLQQLKDKSEFVYLLIGYKRYKLEQTSIALEKEKLMQQLSELKESQKTPQERIKELEDQINSL